MMQYLHTSRNRVMFRYPDGRMIIGMVFLVLLLVTQGAYAKDKPDNGRKPTVYTQGTIRGLETARQRTDGAVVVPGYVRGNGKVFADHIILEGIVSPGNSPGCIDFGGSVTFNSTATLVMELEGTAPCTGYDQISVANTLTINNATMEIVLLNGFVPQFQQRFDLLNWNTLSGGGFAIIDISAATLSYPLQWDLSEVYTTGEVIAGVQAIADGDLAPLNSPDGIINAADILIAMRLAMGELTTGALQYAHGDMNSDGVINIVDLILINKLVFP